MKAAEHWGVNGVPYVIAIGDQDRFYIFTSVDLTSSENFLEKLDKLTATQTAETE